MYDTERRKHGARGLLYIFLWWDDINLVYWVEVWEDKRIFATTDITFHTRTFPYWSAENASISRPLFDEHAPSRSVIAGEESMEGIARHCDAQYGDGSQQGEPSAISRTWQPRLTRRSEHRQTSVGEQADKAPAEGKV
jgi:hypothetical protein